MGTWRTPDASAKIAARHILSWHRRGLVTVLVACLVALMASGVSFGLSGHTSVAHASSCSYYWQEKFFQEAWYQIYGTTSCLGVPPDSEGWIYPCSGTSVTMNMDVWLSQGTTPGNSRLAESGRTGLETWASDCQWHNPTSVTGWGQSFTSPLWACMWVYDQHYNVSFDWYCTQDY